VVCTGGEPLLQLDAALVDAFHAEGFEVAVETNGTQEAPAGVDWLCVSPKANAPRFAKRPSWRAVMGASVASTMIIEPEPGSGMCDSTKCLPMGAPRMCISSRKP